MSLEAASNHDELVALISALCDNRATQSERDRLNQLLVNDKSARRTYLAYMYCEACFYRLASVFGAEVDAEGLSPLWLAMAKGNDEAMIDSDPAPASMNETCILPALMDADEKLDIIDPRTESRLQITPKTDSRPRLWERLMFWWSSAAVVLLGIGIAIGVMATRRHANASLQVASTVEKAPGLELTLVDSDGAVFQGLPDAPRPGQTLPAGTIALLSGTAHLRSSAGVSVVVQGPVAFEMTSPTNLSLLKGTALLDVPHAIGNFAVRTPNANIVDLGTEFGVTVDAGGQSHVDVLQGRVSVCSDAAGARSQIFSAGAACNVGASGECVSAPFQARRFEFAARPDGSSPYDRWMAYGRELRRDPALKAYYTFEYDPMRPGTLVNLAPHGSATDGVIERAKWSEGRFPGKSALFFAKTDESVHVKIPGQYTSLTLWAWVQTARTTHAITSILAADDFNAAGALYWSASQEGHLRMRVSAGSQSNSGPNSLAWLSSRMGLTWPSRNWVLLACVIENGTVRHYLNGAPLSTPPSHDGIPSTGVILGTAQIGNFAEKTQQSRGFSGSIDELGILGRAMNAEEIQKLYDAGKP